MTVRPRGGTWQADVVDANGRRVRKNFKTEAAAIAWEADAVAAVRNGRPLPPANRNAGASTSDGGEPEWTLDEAIQACHKRYWAGTPSAKTRASQMRRVVGVLGGSTPVGKIDFAAIDDLVIEMREDEMAPSTINNLLAGLGKVLKYAQQRRRLHGDLPKIEWVTEGQRGRIRWLTYEEEDRLIDLLRETGQDEAAELFPCLIDTGFRVREMLRAQVRDVDLDLGKLHVWETKGRKPRHVMLTSRARGILARRMQGKAPTDKLWTLSYWAARRAMTAARDVIAPGDSEFVIHALRHTCASRLAQRGRSLQEIQQWLGHSSIKMTERYAHLCHSNFDACAEALEWRPPSAVKLAA